MAILIGCEESQEVTKAFRKLGYEAYSNDILDCSGGHPEWHLKMDVFEALKLNNWSATIFFPPCTYLSNVGNAYFNVERYGRKAIERKKLRLRAYYFFKKLYSVQIPKICIENPVGYMNTNFKKPTQIIHPYYFGDNFKKRTCLWLKNLPPLIHYDHDTLFEKGSMLPEPEPMMITYRKPSKYYKGGEKKNRFFSDTTNTEILRKYNIHFTEFNMNRSKIRSKTFPGIANAMAEQWGPLLEKKIKRQTA